MENQNEYLSLLDLTYHVAQSLEGKTYPDSRFYDCNSLALKLFFHGATLYWLRQGTKAPVPEPNGAYFFDAASAAMISRSIFETYLTMFEVFFDQISNDEREFRHACWLLEGFIIRENVTHLDPDLNEKFVDSQIKIETIRARIKKTIKFQSLTEKQKQAILKGNRLLKKFEDRAKAAGFAPKIVQRMNRYLSSYVHSDGLSAIQLMASKTKEEQQDHFDSLMYLPMMAMSKMILAYKKLFPSAEDSCIAHPQALHLAEVWSEVAQQIDQFDGLIADTD